MQKKIVLRYVLVSVILFVGVSGLSIQGNEAKSIAETPFRTLRYYGDSLFFTAQNGKAFGYLNSTDRAKIEQIYVLQEGETIFDDFETAERLVIGNRNKSLIWFEPVNRTLKYDDRLVGEDFKELRGFMSIKNKAYVITEGAILHFLQQEGELKLKKQPMSISALNQGVQENYLEFHYWPTQKYPERIFVITTASFSKPNEETKLMICFKWFVGQDQDVDGACNYETALNFESFRVTKSMAYMRHNDRTYVYDNAFVLKTRWDNIPTQFVGGYASTADHLTYLFKSNELSYYRQLDNFKNDDFKMTLSGSNLNILKKNKKFVKLTKLENADPIGGWVEEIDSKSIRLVIQYDTADLHMYKIVKSDASTEINYIFRIKPQNPIKSRAQIKKEAELAKAQQAAKQSSSNEAEQEESPQNSVSSQQKSNQEGKATEERGQL